MAAKEKAQDEKNLKTLRELASLPANKYCLDCQQRGPTYVNVTIGSFVCTSCSGILRGLHPPHRIKSITMTSFTPEEMEQIKSKGNEYCKQVWLGKYEESELGKKEHHNVTAIKEFMVQKYENKQYYVEPEFAVRKPKARAPSIPSGTVSQSKSQTVIRTNTSSQLIQKPGWTSQNFTTSVDNSTDSSSFNAFGDNTIQEAANKTGTTVDDSSFADFSSAFVNSNADTFPPQAACTSSQFSNASSAVANSTNQFMDAAAKLSQKKPAPPPPDRYAALADLDNQLHQQQVVTVPVEAPAGAQLIWPAGGGGIAFANALPNPFNSSVPTWTPQSQAANPFQAVPTHLTNQIRHPHMAYTLVGNGIPNGNPVDHALRQNGAVTTSFWSAAPGQAGVVAFPSGQGEAFPNKYSIPVEHYNPWAQSLATDAPNPFASNGGMVTSVTQKSSTNNPFL